MLALSSPVSGSTAPHITSPYMAWPARPIERPSPSPSQESFDSRFNPSSSSSFSSSGPSSSSMTAPLRYDAKGKGKAMDSEGVQSVEDGVRHYGPPKKPLTPHQLGRIAQSFGIVIPSLPQPSPLTPPTTSRSVGATSTRSSPHLLTVVPPLALLRSDTAYDEKKRRWKRGRLIPLQPTIGSMLLAIAREYGLPSTAGLSLYLVTPFSATSSRSSTVSSDECSGPLISPSTWSTLFSTYLHASTSSCASTPSQTPRRPSGPLVRDAPYPLSPLSLIDKTSSRGRFDSSNSLSTSRGSEPSSSTAHIPALNMPPTPTSAMAANLSNAIVGTVEFDIDPDAAPWLEEWLKGGKSHRRNLSSVSDSGISMSGGKRQLRLVKKVERAKAHAERLEFSPRFMDSREDDEADDEGARGISPVDNYTLRSGKAVERIQLVEHSGTMSTAPSLGQFTESSETFDYEFNPDRLGAGLDTRLLDELLASPIELERVQLERVRMAEGPKRGSGVVMAEELDDLERIMRSLSPREIRLTSPKAMTPRMAAKVAAARIQAAGLSVPVHPRQLPPSPLGGGKSSAHTSSQPPKRPVRPPVTPEDSSRTMTDGRVGQAVAMPSVLFAMNSPSHANDLFKADREKGTDAEGSDRSLVAPQKGSTPDWRPARPPRPRSPDLSHFGHARTLSHTLSPEALDQMRLVSLPPASASNSPATPDAAGRQRLRGRASTVNVKGIKRRMSGKNLNLTWGNERDKHAQSLSGQSETIGLFGGDTEGQPASSFASLGGNASATSEFGRMDAEHEVQHQGPDSPRGKQGFSMRFFSFGRKGSTKESSSKHTNPAIKANIISPPITSTFTKNMAQIGQSDRSLSTPKMSVTPPLGEDTPTSPPSQALSIPASPQSPASSRSVRRKPVPGIEVNGEVEMTASDSLGSMRSLVLDEPPKRRKA